MVAISNFVSNNFKEFEICSVIMSHLHPLSSTLRLSISGECLRMGEGFVIASGPVSYCTGQGSTGSVQPLLVCVSGAELQVNATGYNHRSGSLTFRWVFVCARDREEGCFGG